MKQLKIFEIKENENNIYEIEISKLADNIIINAKMKNAKDSKFEKEITFEEIKKVKYFQMFDSIEEYINEIFSQMEIKKPSIKLGNNNLILIFYIKKNFKKHKNKNKLYIKYKISFNFFWFKRNI